MKISSLERTTASLYCKTGLEHTSTVGKALTNEEFIKLVIYLYTRHVPFNPRPRTFGGSKRLRENFSLGFETQTQVLMKTTFKWTEFLPLRNPLFYRVGSGGPYW